MKCPNALLASYITQDIHTGYPHRIFLFKNVFSRRIEFNFNGSVVLVEEKKEEAKEEEKVEEGKKESAAKDGEKK